jgi:hypothetical protein
VAPEGRLLTITMANTNGPVNEPLRRFREKLQELSGDNNRLRPFVCDGSPYDCQAFLVGFNPASQAPMWEFWSDKTGFDKVTWFECYKRLRQSANKPDVSPTRRRVEEFVKTMRPLRVLETNLYGIPTSTERDLRRPDQDARAFEFLLSDIRPKVLVLHGRRVRMHFKRHYGCYPNPNLCKLMLKDNPTLIVGRCHLSRLSVQAVEELARYLRSSLLGELE